MPPRQTPKPTSATSVTCSPTAASGWCRHSTTATTSELIQDVYRLFEAQLGHSNPPGAYCLFGLDVLQLADGRVALVEINDRPNLQHSDEINRLVNQPMLQAMGRLLLGDKVSSAPAVAGFEELMFYEC